MAGTATIEALRSGFAGHVLGPEDDGYDAARRIHNGLIDRRPALIAQCRGTADIADAVRFARADGLEVAVRGGGHNVAGRAVTEDALMIDLSGMKGIHVDAGRATARAQGGVTWGELNRETALHGLAVTGGAISNTGIAGLTLGGGLGWLMSKHGLAADNLVSVELVTADGEVVEVNEQTAPGPHLGASRRRRQLRRRGLARVPVHPLPMVTGGLIAHPVEAGGDMLRWYREAVAACPDELTVFAALVHAPDGRRDAERRR